MGTTSMLNARQTKAPEVGRSRGLLAGLRLVFLQLPASRAPQPGRLEHLAHDERGVLLVGVEGLPQATLAAPGDLGVHGTGVKETVTVRAVKRLACGVETTKNIHVRS